MNDKYDQDPPAIVIALASVGWVTIALGVITAIGIRADILHADQVIWLRVMGYPAITLILSGLISGIIFLGFAATVNYLYGIREVAREIAYKLRQEEADPGTSKDPVSSVHP